MYQLLVFFFDFFVFGVAAKRCIGFGCTRASKKRLGKAFQPKKFFWKSDDVAFCGFFEKLIFENRKFLVFEKFYLSQLCARGLKISVFFLQDLPIQNQLRAKKRDHKWRQRKPAKSAGFSNFRKKWPFFQVFADFLSCWLADWAEILSGASPGYKASKTTTL